MRFSEVRHLHLLRPDWKPADDRWYCLFCIDTQDSGDGWPTEYQVKGHLETAHDVERAESDNGVDFCYGGQLKVILARWRKDNEGVASQFGRALDSLVSVDDFLFETGGS